MLQPTPWQGAYIAIYSTFLGMAMLGFVIDSDHWRLFWMLLGLVWGLTIATRAPAPPAEFRSHAVPG